MATLGRCYYLCLTKVNINSDCEQLQRRQNLGHSSNYEEDLPYQESIVTPNIPLIIPKSINFDMLGECGVYFDPVRRHPINKKYFIDAIGGNGRAEFLLEVHLDPIRKVLPKNGTPLMPVYSTPVQVSNLGCSLKTFVVNLLPEKYRIKAKLYHVSITYFKN